MVRIRIKKGDWKGIAVNVNLIHEKCGNPDCGHNEKGKITYYPHWYKSPICNECRGQLVGSKLYGEEFHRKNYHLTGNV
jgi:hypothetical protein